MANRNDHETSVALINDVLNSTHLSRQRNTDDSANDGPWVPRGQEGLDRSQATSTAATKLIEHLKGGGTFSDAAGIDLTATFRQALKDGRESLIEHRDGEGGALVYAGKNEATGEGKGIPIKAYDLALSCNKKIAEAATKLLAPETKDPKQIAGILSEINKNAASIRTALAGSKDAGKDQLDAIEEAKAINVAAAYLTGPNVDPALRRSLYKGILSKSGLIDNELKDAPIEVMQAKHDTAALKSGEVVEEHLKSALQHPNDAAAKMKVIANLQTLIDNERLVRKDRQDDIKNEPKYIESNKRDNAINEEIVARINEIIKISNIYK
jgi:hypothetical protein